MIEPGWRRRNDVCPQCHMPGRVAQRNLLKQEGIDAEVIRDAGAITIGYNLLKMTVMADVCDNCGTVYAYKAM